MKLIIAFLSFIFSTSFCNAQYQGSITSAEIRPKAGCTNIYIYTPAANLLIPEKIRVLVIYQTNDDFSKKAIPVNKSGNSYQFQFKAPDSTAVLAFAIVDANKKAEEKNSPVMAKEKIVDNNNGSGFIIHLYDKNNKRFNFENIQLAQLLNGAAFYQLQLKERPKPDLIKLYENTYTSYPQFKQGNTYIDYLKLLYQAKGNIVMPKLLAYAKQLQTQQDETSWLNAVYIYQVLKMSDAQDELKKRDLNTFPDGLLAREKYWSAYYNREKNTDTTEESVLSYMNNYMRRFKDSSDNIKDHFHSRIVELLINKKEWAALPKYERLISNKLMLAYTYNNDAWKLCGEQMNSPGNNLDIAKILSKKSLDYIKDSINKSIGNPEDSLYLCSIFNMYADTYALILYKLGQYDSAFYYQDAIYQQGENTNIGSVERYAVYSEKIKGATYTKQVLEGYLLSGISSPTMLKQLQSIYKQLNLPQDEFSKLQQKSKLLARQKDIDAIKEKYGSVKAKDFSLKNLNGKTVALSSLKNKIVVLDFWATWCGPCKASFPAMQEAVNKYKDDSGVAFLFIDI